MSKKRKVGTALVAGGALAACAALSCVDRKDGTRAEVDGFHYFMANLYENRTDAEVFMKESFDVTAVMDYVRRKNEEDPEEKYTPWHIFVQAVAKTVHMRPLLNRFVCGRRFYDRNKVVLSFVVKREFADGAQESMLMAEAPAEMTLAEMRRLIVGDADRLRKGEDPGIVDKIIDVYGTMPRFVQRGAVGVFKWLDFHGILPMDLIEGNLHHATAILSNLGSIKCDAPYHHLNNFGSNSIVVTVGEIHKETLPDEEGHLRRRDVVNMGFTLDERIADGFYFAKSIKLLHYILEHPELLEEPLGTEVDYAG